jgi:hypothetical protein
MLFLRGADKLLEALSLNAETLRPPLFRSGAQSASAPSRLQAPSAKRLFALSEARSNGRWEPCSCGFAKQTRQH